MRTAIRLGTFETNSSSQHAIVVDMSGKIDASLENCGYLTGYSAVLEGELKFATPSQRLTELWSIVLSEYPNQRRQWEKLIREALAGYDIFLADDGRARIGSLGYNDWILDAMEKDPSLLRNYVLGADSVGYLSIVADEMATNAADVLPHAVLFAYEKKMEKR